MRLKQYFPVIIAHLYIWTPIDYDLQKSKPANISSIMGEVYHEVPPVFEVLLTTDGCSEQESQFSQGQQNLPATLNWFNSYLQIKYTGSLECEKVEETGKVLNVKIRVGLTKMHYIHIWNS